MVYLFFGECGVVCIFFEFGEVWVFMWVFSLFGVRDICLVDFVVLWFFGRGLE